VGVSLAKGEETAMPSIDKTYELIDRYRRSEGRVFVSGTQALVRLALAQRAVDRAAGLNTAGFISGYRGSPLGAYDMELWKARSFLEANDIKFVPAVNEDLAATAILGSQQVETDPDRTVDGVFGIWYGKGPGVDRSGDALKHGNAYGSSPHGGVLVVAGDDHGCVSSSMPHQSDATFLAWFMPVLNPASVAEYLEFGLYGFALSRFSGTWVGFKAISETVESTSSVELYEPRKFVTPPNYVPPPDGLHYRWPDLPGVQIEQRLEAKKRATLAFADANPIDKRIFGTRNARYGIVTTGKGHLDLMEALRQLGIDRAEAQRIGLEVYKIGLVWPLAHDLALDFVKDKREVLMVEEKRGIIESQFKEYFYDYPGHKPERMIGKEDENGQPLIPWIGELSPSLLMSVLAKRLDAVMPGENFAERASRIATPIVLREAFPGQRRPYFCSGCPHNTSTKVPEGSKAFAGVGCHFMANWMDRHTESQFAMGSEGTNWVSRSLFNGGKHVFQNVGEGTFYHSGSMAVRQAVAAGVNITFKILFNDAVAMTGGQPVDGPISVEAIAEGVHAEGVKRIAVVSDAPEKFKLSAFPAGTTVDHRDELDRLQRELREIPGVTVLIYEQTCAAEKRRRRKRGTMETPNKTVMINDLVCEGCGDCSVESNCLSVVPLETPFGRKRAIDQASCNKDFSCLNGFCPSFVTVEGGAKRKKSEALSAAAIANAVAGLQSPSVPGVDRGFDLLVTGVGGTGVITVGNIVAMAAHLEGKGASVLDFTGFAQKGGPVLSFVRFAARPADLNQVRIDQCRADALIGCDLVVSTSPQAVRTYCTGHTRAVVNIAELPTGDFVLDRDATLAIDRRLAQLENALGKPNVLTAAANKLADRCLGDVIYSNMLMLGMAWQFGLVPVSLEALQRAIVLNGVSVEANQRAFDVGRLAAADSPVLLPVAASNGLVPEDINAVIERRASFLVGYQNDRLANRYRALVERVRAAEAGRAPSTALTEAVAKSYFKLLAIKDEYEVARLHTEQGFLDRIADGFTGDYRVIFHMAPPLLPGKRDGRGRPRKRAFGPWIVPVLKLLARGRRLRGGVFDVFGYTAERRVERALVGWYEQLIDRLLATLSATNVDRAAAIAAMAMDIRGYGPVKDEAVDKVKARVAEAVAGLDRTDGAPERQHLAVA
jgi:indolepyruvate ferredoxin oxidoreductase